MWVLFLTALGIFKIQAMEGVLLLYLHIKEKGEK